MAFKGRATSAGGTGTREVPEAGTHPAVLVAMIDLGTHEEDFDGKQKSQRKVFLCWELVNERMSGSTMNFVLGKEYTLSYHAKGALRQTAEKLRKKPYQDGEEIDYSRMLGFPCLLTVEVKQSASSPDKSYARVKDVTALPKGMQCPRPQWEPFAWAIEDGGDAPDFDWLPRVFGERIADKVSRSPEWEGREDADDAGEDADAFEEVPVPAGDDTPF